MAHCSCFNYEFYGAVHSKLLPDTAKEDIPRLTSTGWGSSYDAFLDTILESADLF